MPFEKGKSGNPAGRPIGNLPFRMSLIQQLDKVRKKGKVSKKRMDWVADALVEEAENGNLMAISMIAERIDGRVPNPPMAAQTLNTTTTTEERVMSLAFLDKEDRASLRSILVRRITQAQEAQQIEGEVANDDEG